MTTDTAIDAIPGWFWPFDRRLFRWFLDTQAAIGQVGNLAEMGVYLGKSAVLIGDYKRPDETFTVIDLFNADAQDAENADENQLYYRGLTQRAFERNYEALHAALPVVVRGYSEKITDHARVGTHRFVHVDASHMYEHVVRDIPAARDLLAPGGVVALDDLFTTHSPGVAAAVWDEVINRELEPIVISPVKFYGCWTGADEWRARLDEWLPGSGFAYERQTIAGKPVVRVFDPPPPSQPLRTRLREGLIPPVVARRLPKK